MNFILGTAGHIDHGKTTLVRALTGINCDRLEEEQRRGITIELGFAWLDLPYGDRVGIVDVPGHERFIKNMVAGASGIDCVLLVVAADEGVMPQTREHLEICSLLGVRHGLVALTKSDLVDAEWLQEARREIKDTLADSFLEDAPIIAVSSTSGDGLEKLREEIGKQISAIGKEKKSDIFRLPVDRVFSMKGFGTVVTGTIISGACSQEEILCMYPQGKTSRVRNLQVHNTQVETATEGQRCAINLQDLEVEDIQRGDVAAVPGTLFSTKRWIVRLYCLMSSPLPIRQRSEVHFHHGTRECLARIVFFHGDKLEPGQSAIAEVKFDNPLTAVYGDHFVIRAGSPLRTIGGGTVIDPNPAVLRKRQESFQRKLKLLEEIGQPDKGNLAVLKTIPQESLVQAVLELRELPGADLNQLRACTGLDLKSLKDNLEILAEKGLAICWDWEKKIWICKQDMNACVKACYKRAKDLHAREPLKTFFSPSALIAGWGEDLAVKFTQAVINQAINEGILAQEGTGLKLAEHKIKFDSPSVKILQKLQNKIDKGGMTPPFIKELVEEFNWDIKKVQPLLNYLCETGEFIKIQEGVYYKREKFTKIEESIRAWFGTHNELDVGDIKTLLGISRKYAIPILEFLDNSKVTYRVGNKRRLRAS